MKDLTEAPPDATLDSVEGRRADEEEEEGIGRESEAIVGEDLTAASAVDPLPLPALLRIS